MDYPLVNCNVHNGILFPSENLYTHIYISYKDTEPPELKFQSIQKR